MDISLTPYFENFVQSKLANKTYHSASDVVCDGLRLLEERDKIQQIKLGELRHDIRIGITSGDSSELDIEEIKIRGRNKLAKQ